VTGTPLVARFFDVFTDASGTSVVGPMILEEITNYGDQVNRARVGFNYSTAQQQKSFLISSGDDTAIVHVSGAGVCSVLYAKLLWRPFPTGLPPV